MPKTILSLDIGTTTAKALLFDVERQRTGNRGKTVSTPLVTLEPGWFEQERRRCLECLCGSPAPASLIKSIPAHRSWLLRSPVRVVLLFPHGQTAHRFIP